MHNSKILKDRLNRWTKILREGSELPPPPEISWEPKFPQIQWPDMRTEEDLTPQAWERSNFPLRDLPGLVTGQINTQAWNTRIEQLLMEDSPPWGLIANMTEVGAQLTSGASSGVEHPGTTCTHSPNFFEDPITQIPKVVDALAAFISKGHMAGPLFDQDVRRLKINSIMAVKKPGGHVRVVGNLKSPEGLSFNDGIPEEKKKLWPVRQSTAKDFAIKILHAGPGSYMACSDLKDAYKMLPVCLEQRKLQAFKLCGAVFIDLKLIFGDKLACLYFDRFHHCFLQAFVYPQSPMHQGAQGRTVDDVTTVVPACAKQALVDFVQNYRLALQAIGGEAAGNDPDCIKAFDCSRRGEVLGIRFDTENMTWAVPHGKLHELVAQLRALAVGTAYSMRELEVIVGKLNYLCQLWPPFLNFLGSCIQALSEHSVQLLTKDAGIPKGSRELGQFTPTAQVRQDLLMAAAILVDSYDNPLPIIDPDPSIPLHAVKVFTDASGCVKGPYYPSLGIFISPSDGMHGAAFSIPFSTDFLLQSNGSALIADTTSTLEALGLLVPLAIYPDRFVGREVHLLVDNMAVVSTARKKRSSDRLAQTVVKAAFLVAGALDCRLYVSWIGRRSSRSTCIADDLTHGDFSSVLQYDRLAMTTLYEDFPGPISRWMEGASESRDLGHDMIEWIRKEFPSVIR